MSQFFYELKDLVLNWHRDERGIDQTMFGEISLGLTLSNFIWQSSASIIRYSLHYQNQLDEYGKIFIPPDATSLQKRVARGVGDCFDGLMPQVVIPITDEQFLTPEMIAVPKAATIVRTLQPLMKFAIKTNGQLWITDWTTFHTSRREPKSMVLFHRSPSRSAIPHTKSSDRYMADKWLPVDLSEHLNVQVIKKFLNRRGYVWPEVIVNSVVEYLQETYRRLRGTLVTSLAQTLNMLRFYSPSQVSLPADAFESWNMVYQVCASREISTTMYMDGYTVIPFNPLLRNGDNSDFVVHRVAAYGGGQYEMYLRYGFPKERLDIVKPPFLSWETKNHSSGPVFDAIVMTWTPNVLDPYSKFWAPVATLRTALRALVATGHSRIGVKIRHQSEVAYVRSVCEEVGVNASMLSGKFYEHANNSPLFIGGISTALAEVVGRGGRYVIYEPIENGYSDEQLQSSTVVNRDLTARSESQLCEMIEAGRCSWIGDPSINLV